MRVVYQTAQQLDVDLILGIFEENGIQADVRYGGAGDYMKIIGAVYNTDCQIYVSDSNYQKARELIESIFDKECTKKKVKSNQNQRIWAWIMIALWVIVFIGIIAFETLKY